MIKRFLLGFLLLISGIFLFMNIKNHKIEIVNSEDLAVYVNDELVSSIPKKGEAMFIKSVCDNDGKASWDNETWGLLVTNMSKKTKCNLYFYEGQTIFNFDYTGGEQTFTAPVSGTYKLETWGAQGGDYFNALSGLGGYSVGNIELEKNDVLYIAVGGKGTDGFASTNGSNISAGGYNGGGSGGRGYNFEYNTGSGGGGATSIQNLYINDGLLKNYVKNISNILIVSGGGGGFYGGYTSLADGTLSDDAGAGGSGYIGNPLLKDKVMYCYNCEESSDESTKTISTTCNEETPTSYCAKKGNGYARITLVSIDE